MATITKAGRALRVELNDLFHILDREEYIELQQQDLCSLLMRRAKRYANMQEQACSYEWACGDAWGEKEARLEAAITDLAKTLPGVNGVKFTGDPRGYTVRLLLDCGKGNTWGGDEAGWGIA